MTIQTSFTVTSEGTTGTTTTTTLNGAIQSIDVGGSNAATDTNYTITLGNDITLNAATDADLLAINLPTGSTLTIDGANYSINGEGDQRGLLVYSGTVNVNSVTLTNMQALGGVGGGGAGGGAGLGGGLFVASAGSVVLDNVSFTSDKATGGAGGAGGAYVPAKAGNGTTPYTGGIIGGGGGGMGGNGGSAALDHDQAGTNHNQGYEYFGVGGGGGIGLGANGGNGQTLTTNGSQLNATPGLSGIIPGAAAGGSGASSGGYSAPGGAHGGGGGGGQSSGGGGGGVGGVSASYGTNPKGGFGGGGGDSGSSGKGGTGGFGGGGGAAEGGSFGSTTGGGGRTFESAPKGGSGGFGGGGGSSIYGTGGQGGFGAGKAGAGPGGPSGYSPGVAYHYGYSWSGGGGGLGAGGDVFVQQGGSLTIEGGSLSGGTVTKGDGGAVTPIKDGGNSTAGSDGGADGSGIFIQGTQTVTLAPLVSTTLTISDNIADQTGNGGTGSNLGAGSLNIDGPGTVELNASTANTYTGITTLTEGTLDLASAGAVGTSTITFATSSSAILQIAAVADKPTNTIKGFIPAAGTIDIEGIGTATSATIVNHVLTVDYGASSSLTLNLDSTVDYSSDHVAISPDAGATGSDLTIVSGEGPPPSPTISSAAYNASTGKLTVTGTNFTTSAGDYSATALTLKGEGGTSYTLTGGSIEANPTSTTFVVDLSTADQLAIDGLLNKNGTSSVGHITYNLAATTSFDTGGAADTTSAVTVSNALTPTISSVSFNYATGVLTLTGTGFENEGGTGGLRLGDFTLKGQGGSTYTLATANAAVTSETAASITLTDGDLTNVKALFDANGTASLDSTTYNLAAAPGWDSVAGATITTEGVTVSGVPSPPVVVPESMTVVAGATATGTSGTAGTGALAGDSDPNSATLSISAVAGGTVGSSVAGTYGHLTLNADGSYSYVADNAAAIASAATGSHPIDTFDYTVSDTDGASTAATLTITIDRPPVAMADTNTAVAGGSAATGNVETNDTNLDGDTLTVTGFTDGSSGTVGTLFHGTYGDLTLNADGTYSYSAGATVGEQTALANAATGSHPTEVITYTESDGLGDSTSSTLTITIDRPPTLGSVATTVGYGSGPITLSPSLVAADPDGDNLTGATVVITGGFADDGDTLTATTTNTNITASYDSADETLTLSGSDTAANYTAVLDSVTFDSLYYNANNAGANDTRTVTWTVSDGSLSNTTSPATTIQIGSPAVDDYTGDGTSDVLFRDDTSGAIGFDAISNGATASWQATGGSNSAYVVVGSGDFTGDGTDDVMFRDNSTGDTGYYAITDGAVTGWERLGTGTSTAYTVDAVGDFTGNGTDDILFRNDATGDMGYYQMSPSLTWQALGGSSSAYSVVGAGDFYGNGTDDILFRDNSTGDVGFDQMSGGSITSWVALGGSSTAYSVVGIGDFMGNGTDDILFRDNSTGDMGFDQMSNGGIASWVSLGGSSTAYSVVDIGDYYGNGTSDILMHNSTTGDTGFYAISNGAVIGWHDLGTSPTTYHVAS